MVLLTSVQIVLNLQSFGSVIIWNYSAEQKDLCLKLWLLQFMQFMPPCRYSIKIWMLGNLLTFMTYILFHLAVSLPNLCLFEPYHPALLGEAGLLGLVVNLPFSPLQPEDRETTSTGQGGSLVFYLLMVFAKEWSQLAVNRLQASPSSWLDFGNEGSQKKKKLCKGSEGSACEDMADAESLKGVS